MKDQEHPVLHDIPIGIDATGQRHETECTAEQAYTWSKGKALFAAGVQFPDVTMDGKTFHPLAERPRDTRAWIEGQLYKPQY